MVNLAKPMVIGHRGASNLAPENTLASFSKALELGVDAVEFDILETADHRLVVHHDYVLGKTDNGCGFICETDFKTIRFLDAGSWFSPEFSHEKIPLFEEVVELCRGKCRMEIEVKITNSKSLKKILRILNDFDVIAEVELTSPHIPTLFYIKKQEPKMRIGMFASQRSFWMPQLLADQQIANYLDLLSADVGHFPITMLNQEIVDLLHRKRKLVHAADCNTVSDIEKAVLCGVDQLSTDNIPLTLHILSTLIQRD